MICCYVICGFVPWVQKALVSGLQKIIFKVFIILKLFGRERLQGGRQRGGKIWLKLRLRGLWRCYARCF